MADTDQLLHRARAELDKAAACDGLDSTHHTVAAAAAYAELDQRLGEGDPVPVAWLLARARRQRDRGPIHRHDIGGD